MKFNYQIIFPIAWLILAGASVFVSCKHDPFLAPIDPVDTTSTIDTTMTDTTGIDTTGVDTTTIDTVTGIPCDPDVIYFEKDILPILISNCAFSGCHDAASAEDGVILIDYVNTIMTADVEPFNLDDSEIYEVLVDSDLDERMPPVPTAPLPADQIQLIAKWILQGGENRMCDEMATGCDTTNVSFSTFVKPLLDMHCLGCHSGSSPSGGILLTDYSNILTVVQNGSLLGSIQHENGFTAMPIGNDQLPQCDIDKIKSWIDAGALDN